MTNEYDDFEDWEDDYYFFDKQDRQGLVELRRRKAELKPKDSHCQWELGEAYVLNKEFEKAISFLGKLHQKDAKDINVQHSLLDALMGLGKDETDFEWIIRPAVMKLDKKTSDYFYEYLHPKRKPRTVADLYIECYHEGYPMFSEDKLMNFFQSDSRFITTGSHDCYYDCLVAVNRKVK